MICIVVIVLECWCHMRMRPARLVSYAFLYATSVMRNEKVSTNHCCIPAPMHENFRYQNFLKRQIFCPCEVLKNFLLQRVMSRFSVENFLSHSTETFRRGTLLCFTKFLVWKKFVDERGGRSITIFCQKFFVPQCQKFSWGNRSALCSGKFPVAKKFRDKREGGRIIKIFRLKFFVSQCRKTS